ncbi:MAG: Periplasmic copper-binding protein (NosD) [Candidatus Bathyarchaeota archaeon BA2]|nr:MAG: Periplasmic copper-binding protein (NosD) [Candidatus Bathyarchaeota archaeon BA2]
MEKKIVSGIVVALLLIGMLTLAFNIQSVKSDYTWTETIYIRADGSVYPPDAPISSDDNITYTLTDNIVGNVPYRTSAIVVERDNIVVDGANNTLQCSMPLFPGTGVYLGERSSVTVKNMKIKSFYCGIVLNSSSYSTISGNSILSSYVCGIHLSSSSNNKFYHNNFIDNDQQVYIEPSSYANVWDDGYPPGGNYWSDYTGVDEKSGPNQNQPGSDGIGDTPYKINATKTDDGDRYPLMNPVVYDVAVTSVVPQKTVVGQGYALRVNVTILNQGNFTQTFDVTLYANTTSIASQEITLTSGKSTTITFTWNTTDVPYGNYTISATAAPVPGETDTTDNTYVDGIVVVKILGDIDGDGDVDVDDFYVFSRAYGTSPASNPGCDLDGDGDVDKDDFYMFAGNYGKSI